MTNLTPDQQKIVLLEEQVRNMKQAILRLEQIVRANAKRTARVEDQTLRIAEDMKSTQSVLRRLQ